MKVDKVKAEARRKLLEALGGCCSDVRDRAGLSQGDMAKMSGYDRSVICRFEQGHCDSAVLLWYYMNIAGGMFANATDTTESKTN